MNDQLAIDKFQIIVENCYSLELMIDDERILLLNFQGVVEGDGGAGAGGWFM